MTEIRLPSEWPAGWAVGCDVSGEVALWFQHVPAGRIAAEIDYAGFIEEDTGESVACCDENIPAPVLSTARALHRSLGRPCPWDAQGGLTLEQAAIASGCTGESISVELHKADVASATAWLQQRWPHLRAVPDQDQTTASDPDPPSATPETGADDPERGQEPDCHECVHYRDQRCHAAGMPEDGAWVVVGSDCKFEPIPALETYDRVLLQRDEWTDHGVRLAKAEQRLGDHVAWHRAEYHTSRSETGQRLVMAEGRLLDLLELLRSEHSPVDSDAEDLQAAWDEEDDQAQETETKTETPPQRHPCRDCEAGPGTAKDAGARAEKETGTRTGCG